MKKNKKILKIENLNVEFPLFGGILQREVSAVHAVKNVNLEIRKEFDFCGNTRFQGC